MTTPTVLASDERQGGADQPAIDVERWRTLALQALVTEGATGELALIFVDDSVIAELNAEYMGSSGPTDVLSFPIDDDDGPTLAGVPTLLGDVVISPDVAARQFVDHAGTFDDEIALLVVHGVLHVLGHDHADPTEAALMRTRERALLEEHHWAGPAPEGFRQTHD